MYTVDLIGASSGALLAIVALDYWDFSSAVILATAFPLLAAIAFGLAANRYGMTTGILVVGLLGISCLALEPIRTQLEPQPHLGTLGRTQHKYLGYDVKQLWHTWTSFGRIAAIELTSPDDKFTRTVMVHGKGEGHARVFPAGEASDDRLPKPIGIQQAVRLMKAGCKPDRALVLMAGAGADMVLIDRMTDGKSDITGIEIAPEVFEWPSRQNDEFGLGEFFSRPNIHIRAAEGREFLARDKSKYDCILRSFSGASLGYFTGVTASAPTYLKTKEGLSEIVSHLAPGGQLTLIHLRISDMLTIAKILKERGRESVQDVFILCATRAPRNESEYLLSTGNGNAFFLMVKPDGFTEADVANAKDVVADEGLQLIYHPNQVAAEQTVINRLVQSDRPVCSRQRDTSSIRGLNIYGNRRPTVLA